MKCPRCGNENQIDALLCAICGSSLVVTQLSATPPYFQQQAGSIPSRDIGGLIGETFSVYRKSFWPFFLIALLTQIPSLIAMVAPGFPALFLILLNGYILILAFGATIHAVTQQYTGRVVYASASIGDALRSSLTLTATTTLFGLALIASVVLMVVAVGFIIFLYLLVSWFFFAPVIVLEGKGPIASLERSRQLVKGDWLRVLGIGTVFVLIALGLAIVAAIPSVLLTAVSTILGDLFDIIVQVLIFPVTAIGATLVYMDLRARKEGYIPEGMD